MKNFRITVLGRSRPLLFVLALLLLAAVFARAEPEIRSITEVINGHSTGGVTVDAIGDIYVADFGDVVWKITPDGERHVFASGLYGASGNASDNEGSLLQSNFYGNSITKIDRNGQTKPFVTAGLSGPVGIAVDRQTGEVYVANCRGNSIAKIATDGTVSSYAKRDLFKCPNGISFDNKGNLYVVNYRDNKMLKIDPKGVVTPFATVSPIGTSILQGGSILCDRLAIARHLRGDIGWNRQAHPGKWRAWHGGWSGSKGAALFPQRNRVSSMGATALHQRVRQ